MAKTSSISRGPVTTKVGKDSGERDLGWQIYKNLLTEKLELGLISISGKVTSNKTHQLYFMYLS